MSIVARNSPAPIPPPDLTISSPVSVTTVSLPVALIRVRMIRIGTAQMSRKKVLSRSSFAG
jgi:hypothetical protein